MKRSMVTLAVMLSAVLVAGCGGYNSGPGSITSQTSEVSDCGGFAKQGDALFDVDPAYCQAEMLLWQYDQGSATLRLANTRVLLNCCGDHSVKIEEQEDFYLVTERDAPESQAGGARCSCMCVFDFSIEAAGISTGVIRLQLVRQVTDDADSSGVIFDGELDLTAGSGSIVIDDTDVYPWCGE
ncbi:MAG TPA: hypothetical protein VM425_12315 [Myxococcota bacterium]|nr:hypothetical protein [Myxococcota bacterium]